MHPLMILVSTLGGIQVLGILGLVVGAVSAAGPAPGQDRILSALGDRRASGAPRG